MQKEGDEQKLFLLSLAFRKVEKASLCTREPFFYVYLCLVNFPDKH